MSYVSASISQAWHRTAALQEEPSLLATVNGEWAQLVRRAGQPHRHTKWGRTQASGLPASLVHSWLSCWLHSQGQKSMRKGPPLRVATQGAGVVLGKQQTLVWLEWTEQRPGKEQTACGTKLWAVV